MSPPNQQITSNASHCIEIRIWFHLHYKLCIIQNIKLIVAQKNNASIYVTVVPQWQRFESRRGWLEFNPMSLLYFWILKGWIRKRLHSQSWVWTCDPVPQCRMITPAELFCFPVSYYIFNWVKKQQKNLYFYLNLTLWQVLSYPLQSFCCRRKSNW